MAVSRKASIREALRRLGPRRIENFLRTIAATDSDRLSVSLINEALDRGGDVSDVLLEGGVYGYQLDVKGRGRKFLFMFGCLSGAIGRRRWVVERDVR